MSENTTFHIYTNGHQSGETLSPDQAFEHDLQVFKMVQEKDLVTESAAAKVQALVQQKSRVGRTIDGEVLTEQDWQSRVLDAIYESLNPNLGELELKVEQKHISSREFAEEVDKKKQRELEGTDFKSQFKSDYFKSKYHLYTRS